VDRFAGFPMQSSLRRLCELICLSRSITLKSITFMTSMSIYRNHAMSLLRNIASDEIEKESIRSKFIVI